jgi:cellulose synthase/poly-beta-1,6-N-acetylglucosamine synthase-like glycosyltransferase
MLLYHMFLAQGGYMHFRRFEKVIPTWEQKLAERYPTVALFIPAHNEGVVIEKTLKAMVRLKYPKDKLQIVLICDNCSDNTKEIGDRYAEQFPFVKVLETEGKYKGRGKSTALNYALMHTDSELIAVYDADNTPERYAVHYLAMGLVNDEKAGAMVGKFRVINAKQTWLTHFINIETICFQWMAQAGRWFWFGVATIPGTNFAIRRTIIQSLGGWDESAMAEDTELSVRVYDLGYHIRFFPAAITWEQEPETLSVWWKQRTRWARGNQYVVLKFLRHIFELKQKRIVFDIFYFFFTYFLFFFGVITSNIIFVLNFFFDFHLTIGNIAIILWVLAFLLFMTEVMITLSIEKDQLTLKNIVYVFLMYFTYSQMWIVLVVYSLFLEIKRVVRKEEHTWYKTERFPTERGK